MRSSPSVRLTFFPLVVAGLLCGCSNTRTPPSERLVAGDTLRLAIEPIDEVANAFYSGIEGPRREVIRTESEWRELWSQLAARTIPPPEPPVIDFEQRMVIVAAMGRKPTGGYAIAIEEVRASADSVYVDIVEISPGRNCMTTQALTAPVAAVQLERRDGEVVFLEREEDRPCG